MFGPAMAASPFSRGKSRKAPRERKPRTDREHAEAVALMNLVRTHEARWPILRWMFAVPNGGARDLRTGAKMKAEGVRRGVPDYLLPARADGCVGLALELKAEGGRLAPEQKEWLAHLEAQGWRCVVAYGAEEAWQHVRSYVLAYEIAHGLLKVAPGDES